MVGLAAPIRGRPKRSLIASSTLPSASLGPERKRLRMGSSTRQSESWITGRRAIESLKIQGHWDQL